MLSPLQNVPLARLTTLHLGGPAKYFVECSTEAEVKAALTYARANNLRVFVLGGASNVIIPDEGVDGLVLKVNLHGIETSQRGGGISFRVGAGEVWDDLVWYAVEKDLTGIECLSGIPGLVGATPIQNVGAYGQEVSETITLVEAIDRSTFEARVFTADECVFEYRKSRFNTTDMNKYVITRVTLRLEVHGQPVIRYPELRKYIDEEIGVKGFEHGHPTLRMIRSAVLALRRRKSMVVDQSDPNSRSVGSFFKNPLLNRSEFNELEARVHAKGMTEVIPTFPAGDGVKIPAAWLVEKAGFTRGYRVGGVGISSNHALALINCNGTTRELLALSETIRTQVFESFGIALNREPILLQ